MQENRYILEKYKGPSSRYTCPGCGYSKEFTRYVDTVTGQYVSSNVGICNRIDKCRYHRTPKQYFEANGEALPQYQPPRVPVKIKECFTMPIEAVNKSMTNYHQNSFAMCLVNLLGESEAIRLLKLYECIGTSAKYPEACVFWQINAYGQVRTGKIMKYKPDFHREDFTTWVHCGIIPEYQELRQCFFGEHLLTLMPKHLPVAIVESEKTAVVCSHFLPDFIWMAAGNMEGLTERKFQALKGRDVILFPDLGMGHDKWLKKANEYRHITNIQVSNYLNKISNEDQKREGLDLADIFIDAIKENKRMGLKLSPLEGRCFTDYCEYLDEQFKNITA
jgi:hypothetical protein